MIFKAKWDSWEARFEIISAPLAAKACIQSLDFFGDPITREDESDEETIRVFLQFWLPHIIKLSIEIRAVEFMIEAIAGWEGCVPLDGTQGIRLIACDTWSFDGDLFSIEKEAA